MKKKVLQIISYILVAFLASLVTFIICGKPNFEGDWAKLDEISYNIKEQFVGEVDEKAMLDAAAAGLVEGTGDRWSYYVPAEEVQAYQENMANAYVGIGVTIQLREDGQGIDIIAVTKGGPAEEAGLLPGDILHTVEGKKVSDLGTDGTKALIQGETGTKVQLTVLRDGQEKAFTVTRRAIETVVATGKLLGDVGLVTIVNFNDRCAQTTISVIEELRRQGAKSIIFDVRFNPGGYRHELVELLDYLLPEGVLFRSEDYKGRTQEDKSDAAFLDMPMAVLVNGSSYSAAEFFAAALREYEAATVVGTQTCGKGYSQIFISLSDGSGLNLSTAKYFTPKGVSLAEEGGLIPDVVVEVDDATFANIYYGLVEPEDDPQIQAALNVLMDKE